VLLTELVKVYDSKDKHVKNKTRYKGHRTIMHGPRGHQTQDCIIISYNLVLTGWRRWRV